ncbi:MAG: site-2 protease family protein [Eubacteriales bacterium]|nr:site-2 protease family protein [Eubacteriales bacterium]
MFNLQSILIGLPTTLLALTVHEFAHGWVSTKLGDPTPRYEGRLTMNPMAHLDLIGTILMIITGFGWAKPVRINPNYYKNRTKGMALVAAAGPLANFFLAFIGILVGYIIILLCLLANVPGTVIRSLENIVFVFAFRNLCFMVFNLIPLPPLDGFKVAGLFIPNRIYYNILRYEQYVILVIMLLSLSGAFNSIIGTGVNFFMNMLFNAVWSILGIFI